MSVAVRAGEGGHRVGRIGLSRAGLAAGALTDHLQRARARESSRSASAASAPTVIWRWAAEALDIGEALTAASRGGGVPAAQNFTVWQNRATVWQNRATVWQNRATVWQNRATVGQSNVTVCQNRAPLGRPLAPLWQATRHTGARPPPHWGAPRGPTGADRPAHCAGFLAQWGLLGLLCPLGLVCHTLLLRRPRTTSMTVSSFVASLSLCLQLRRLCHHRIAVSIAVFGSTTHVAVSGSDISIAVFASVQRSLVR
jgi:hypothetical protein